MSLSSISLARRLVTAELRMVERKVPSAISGRKRGDDVRSLNSFNKVLYGMDLPHNSCATCLVFCQVQGPILVHACARGTGIKVCLWCLEEVVLVAGWAQPLVGCDEFMLAMITKWQTMLCTMFEVADRLKRLPHTIVSAEISGQIPTSSARLQCAMEGFKYFLVMDFEATCEDKNIKKQWVHEIIEFPAVLLDAATLEILGEFREFVKPTEQPRLTGFCTNLTSIQQNNVDAAATLPVVLGRFGSWLDSHGLDLNPAAALPVTCGDWDLKTMLPNEAFRKGLEYHPTLWWWCNIKHVFQHTMRDTNPRGMEGMMSKLKLRLEGHHHLGIDDARNITRILQTLVRRYGVSVSSTGGCRPWQQRPRQLKLAPADTLNTQTISATNLSETEKKFLKAARDVRAILKLESQRTTMRLDRKQEEKIARKGIALEELAEFLNLLSPQSELTKKNSDVIDSLVSSGCIVKASSPVLQLGVGPTNTSDMQMQCSEFTPQVENQTGLVAGNCMKEDNCTAPGVLKRALVSGWDSGVPPELQKEARKLKKMLREIEALETRIAHGETLPWNQEQKLVKKESCVERLRELGEFA